MALKYSLVIPCFNEAANLPLLLERCALLSHRSDLEVVLVDNGSTDDTPRVLANALPAHPNCRAVRVEVNRGYGHGIITGLRATHGEYLGWTHADLQTDPSDVLRAIAMLEQPGREAFVKGLRQGRPLGDVAFTVGMSVFESLLLARPMWDINAQPTMFSRRFFETWREPPDDFSLDLYAYHQALTQGLMVRRLPVVFAERAHGVSHWNVDWAAKGRFIRRTIAYSLALRQRVRP
jgi:glycosyltransferase involved in cell wall biosynthesis